MRDKITILHLGFAMASMHRSDTRIRTAKKARRWQLWVVMSVGSGEMGRCWQLSGVTRRRVYSVAYIDRQPAARAASVAIPRAARRTHRSYTTDSCRHYHNKRTPVNTIPKLNVTSDVMQCRSR